MRHEVSAPSGLPAQFSAYYAIGAPQIPKESRLEVFVVIRKPSRWRLAVLDSFQFSSSQKSLMRVSDYGSAARDPEDLASLHGEH